MTMNAQVTPRTGKPVAAGILDIIVGSLCLLVLLGFGIVAAAASAFVFDFPAHLPLWIGIFAVVPAAMSVVSIVGGAMATQRRGWGWALAGSITTLCMSNVLGIVSLILTILSRDEFRS